MRIIFLYSDIVDRDGSVYSDRGSRLCGGRLSCRSRTGSTLCVVRTGNAHCNDVFTEDGYLLQYDETLGYVYAEVDRDASLTASGVVAHDAHCRKVDEMEYLKGYDADAISEALAYKYQEYERD